ncbi:MAG: prepilin-type N-terminal cleavage/methylation domain-containing protein [Acidiferrobacterales bacterium]
MNFPARNAARGLPLIGLWRTLRVSTAARGFSLIEMVVSIVLLGVLAAAAIPVLTSGINTFQATTASIDSLSKLRYATERMVREIREVRRNPGNPANYDIATMTATTLVFTKTDGNTVTITASLPNVMLGYAIPAASAVLTDQLTGLTFNYYQIDDVTAATSTANIAFVQLTLTMTSTGGGSFTQRAQVALRNQS